MKRAHCVWLMLSFFMILILYTGIPVEAGQGLSSEKVPSLELKDMDGKRVSLSKFRGKVVLLNFWATWCPYCRKERAELNSLQKDYEKKGLVILSVAGDRSVQKVKRYLHENPADFIVLFDGEGTASYSFGVRALPTNFLIDRDGRVRKKYIGYRDWSSPVSREAIEDLLGR